MIGTSACTSTPGAQNLAVSSPSYAPMAVAYNDGSGQPAPEPLRASNAAQGEFMPVGGPTPAPSGFLDLCQRSPTDCAHSSVYNPDKIRTLAHAATVERYRLAFASVHQNAQIDANANMQSASVATPADANAPAATTDGAHYLNWPGQNTGSGQNTGPVSYVQPLQREVAPGRVRSLLSLPGLVAPAANGYVSDFLDLSVNPSGWTQLGNAAPVATPRLTGSALIDDVQPGAISDGAAGSRLSWNNKADSAQYVAPQYAAIVPVSAESTHAPSIQYDIPNEPYDWAHVHVPAPRDEAQPAQSVADVRASQSQADTGRVTSDYVRIDMNARNANLVRSVNDEVNRTMRGATDEEVYHVADYWNAPPLVRGVRGDCEDFALEKRRLLIENGVPAAAISIAIVRTRQGEDHAVLIVSSWEGDYVLDNLQYDVKPWQKTDYTWVSRQGPADDLTWVSLAPANNRTHSPWQTRTLRVAYAQ